MVKLVHHEMPVNKTLHHRKIEILAVLTLLIGSLSFLIYSYCSHDANNPLCRCLLCTLNHTPEDGEYLYNRYLVVISITWAALIFGTLFVILYHIERKITAKLSEIIRAELAPFQFHDYAGIQFSVEEYKVSNISSPATIRRC